MLEQIKQAIDEFNALDIKKSELLTESNALHKQFDKLRMDRYNLQCKLDTGLVENEDEQIAKLLDTIRKTNAAIKETETEYRKTQKEYSHTWPKTDLAKKKVEKLKKKFWEQEGLTL